MKYIPRAITPILEKRVETSKCALLTGARQVGKSTVIKETFPAYTIVCFDDVFTNFDKKSPTSKTRKWRDELSLLPCYTMSVVI